MALRVGAAGLLMLNTCMVLLIRLTTYAWLPETVTDTGRDPVAMVALRVGAAGLLMLNTCMVLLEEFAT